MLKTEQIKLQHKTDPGSTAGQRQFFINCAAEAGIIYRGHVSLKTHAFTLIRIVILLGKRTILEHDMQSKLCKPQ